MKTADELVADGLRLSRAGNMVVFLYPSQEWMAVQEQIPFLRYEPLIRPPLTHADSKPIQKTEGGA